MRAHVREVRSRVSGPPSRGPLSNYVREGPERGPYGSPGEAFRRRSLPVIRRAVAYVKNLILGSLSKFLERGLCCGVRGSVSKRARARERGHIAACCGVLWRVVVVGVFVHNTRSEIGYINGG